MQVCGNEFESQIKIYPAIYAVYFRKAIGGDNMKYSMIVMLFGALTACATGSVLDLSDPQVQQRLEAQRNNPDLELLTKIKLPEKASKQQVREYINTIMHVSRNQQVHLASDPQVSMLVAVGHENLDELLLVARAYLPCMEYIVEAIEILATEEDKDKIIRALDHHPPLVKVIIAKKWVAVARNVLIQKIQEKPGYLPYEWIAAVASFQDRTTYDALIEYFVNGANRRITYKYIAQLPCIDLTNAVPVAWEKSRSDRYEITYLTEAALSVGYLPALDFVVETLDNNNGLPLSQYSPRALLFQFTGMQGNNDELKKWYGSNRNNLKFDLENKRFVVKRE